MGGSTSPGSEERRNPSFYLRGRKHEDPPFANFSARRYGTPKTGSPNVVRLANIAVVVGLVAAAEERESGLFTEEEPEEV